MIIAPEFAIIFDYECFGPLKSRWSIPPNIVIFQFPKSHGLERVRQRGFGPKLITRANPWAEMPSATDWPGNGLKGSSNVFKRE